MTDSVMNSRLEDQENPGQWLKRQCEQLNITPARVAKEARISKSTLSRWMSDQHKPYWDNIQRVQAVINGFWSKKSQAG